MRVFGLSGWSGAGKTTLLRRLIPVLVDAGLRVSTLKHAHHEFDVDQPGKDSWEHRQAGATEVMVASARRWALMHELRGAPEPRLPVLLAHLGDTDLVLIEGFKREPHPKLEIHRPSLGKPLMQPHDRSIVAIVSDAPLAARSVPVLDVPVLDLNDAAAIAAFVRDRAVRADAIDWCGLDA